MFSRLHPFFAVAGAALCLSACGGGSSGSASYNPSPPSSGGGGAPGAPASVSVTPTSLAFSGAAAGAQTFTVSSTTPNAPAPTIDPFGCNNVATVTANSTTLPATYTVTPTGNGLCTVVVTIGDRSATLGINVGGGSGPAFTSTANPLTFTLGGPAQTFTATASSGTLSGDAVSCNGVVNVTGGGGASPQTFTISPVGVGTCTFAVIDGSSAILVPIAVNAASPGGSNGGNAVVISPGAMSFASPYDTPQQISIGTQGQPGSISIDESSCVAANAKIAYLTINGVAPGQAVTPPVTATVTPYGTGGYNVPGAGSCTINFNATNGAGASLTVVVNR